MRARWRSVPPLLVALVTLLGVGCGRSGTGGGGAAAAPVTTVERSIGTLGFEVIGIAAGDDPAALVVTAADVPVGAGPCTVEIETMLEYEADRIYVTLLHELEQTHVYEVVEEGFVMLDGETAVDGCDRAPQPVEIALDGPLAGRAVITQWPTARWQPGPDGAYARCELPACDPSTGQPPAPPACGDATLPGAVRRGDVPRRAYIDVRACELPWAVVDIDTGAGACPATGEPFNPCAGQQIDRSYWKVVDGRWDVVAYSSGPGCGAVRDVLPDLPEHLCAGLPPVP